MAKVLALSLLLLLGPGASPCFGLGPEGPADIVRSFAPVGKYAGHWGIDIALPEGSEVRALGEGVVTFAGSVAGRLSVTVDHGGSVRTSYSYLARITTSEGRQVDRGTRLGVSGAHGDVGAVHVSLRIGARYIDPLSLGRCSEFPQPGLWLSSPFASVS